MKVFYKNKANKQLENRQKKNAYIKRISIFLSIIVLFIGIIMFAYAIFE